MQSTTTTNASSVNEEGVIPGKITAKEPIYPRHEETKKIDSYSDRSLKSWNTGNGKTSDSAELMRNLCCGREKPTKKTNSLNFK